MIMWVKVVGWTGFSIFMMLFISLFVAGFATAMAGTFHGDESSIMLGCTIPSLLIALVFLALALSFCQDE